MDELATRLKDTSEGCMKAYELWSKDNKDSTAREALQDAVHELRKVAARLEIEVAVSERDENGKALPIPGHNSYSRGRQKPRKPSPNKGKGASPKAPSKADAGNELPAFISGGEEKKTAKAPAKTEDKDAKTA